MHLIAILLLIVAAFTHAGWNLMSKQNQPSPAFFLVANNLGCLVFLPVVVPNIKAYAAFPPAVWGWVVLTGFAMAFYYKALALGYRNGAMSIVYPLARSIPLVIVTVVVVLMGKRDQLSGLCAVGIALIVVGCFLLPMVRFGDFRLRNYLNAACLLAVLAAIGTAGYSMIDDRALRILRGDAAHGLGVIKVTILYLFMETVSTAVWLLAMVGANRRDRQDLREVLRTRKFAAALIGACIGGTYMIVLVSMAFVRNVSYVVAFRQTSILVGAVLGVVVLKEAHPAPKLMAIGALFVGLVLVALG